MAGEVQIRYDAGHPDSNETYFLGKSITSRKLEIQLMLEHPGRDHSAPANPLVSEFTVRS